MRKPGAYTAAASPAGTCAALLPAPLAAKARATADDTATVAAHNAGLIAQLHTAPGVPLRP